MPSVGAKRVSARYENDLECCERQICAHLLDCFLRIMYLFEL